MGRFVSFGSAFILGSHGQGCPVDAVLFLVAYFRSYSLVEAP